MKHLSGAIKAFINTQIKSMRQFLLDGFKSFEMKIKNRM